MKIVKDHGYDALKSKRNDRKKAQKERVVRMKDLRVKFEKELVNSLDEGASKRDKFAFVISIHTPCIGCDCENNELLVCFFQK